MKTITLLILLLPIIILQVSVIQNLNQIVQQRQECESISGGQYWYMDNEDRCCVTVASGWYEPEEGTITRFIFGKNKRWRDFDCKNIANNG